MSYFKFEIQVRDGFMQSRIYTTLSMIRNHIPLLCIRCVSDLRKNINYAEQFSLTP